MKAIMLLLVVVGCGATASSPPSQTPPGTTEPPSKLQRACADAIGKAVRDRQLDGVAPDVRLRVEARHKKRMDELTVKLGAAYNHRCVEDVWTDAVLDCYAKAITDADMATCHDKLPAAAASKLTTDEVAAEQAVMREPGDSEPPVGPGSNAEPCDPNDPACVLPAPPTGGATPRATH